MRNGQAAFRTISRVQRVAIPGRGYTLPPTATHIAVEELPPRPADTGTIGKAVRVLDVVAAEQPVRFTRLMERLGTPRATLHRLLKHLQEEGFVALRADGAYELGVHLLRLAASSWAGSSLRAVAEPHLAALHEATGETVHLGVLARDEVAYLDKVDARRAVRMHSQVGNTSPLYCTGVGKAILAALPDERLVPLLARIEYHPFTAATVSNAAEAMVAVRAVRAEGVAHDREEHEPGIRCVAAAIAVAGTTDVAAVSVTAPAYRLDEGDIALWKREVARAAAAIEDDVRGRLGPRPRI